MYAVIPSDSEIDGQLNIANEVIDTVGSRYHGMSYEEGVRDGISWALGFDSSIPLEPFETPGDEGDEEEA